MISGPCSPTLSPLNYQVWAIAEVFIASCNQSPKTVPEFKDALQLIWSALREKALENTVEDFCKQLHVGGRIAISTGII